MNTEIKIQLKQCFDLMAKIREEYPEGDFDREMVHGDMDFRYRRISEMREKLQTLPAAVYDFARFINTLRIPEEAVKSIFRSVMEDPELFAPLVGLGFKQRREMTTKRAAELEIPAGNIDELLTRSRLSGILDAEYKLNASYRNVIAAYLAL